MFFISQIDKSFDKTLESLNEAMRDWTRKAARGECAWICADCCCTVADGMPNECIHGNQQCTDIITRDKAESADHSFTKTMT